MERKKIKIWIDSKIINRTIEFTTSEPWELRLLDEFENQIEYSTKGDDLFSCLTILREQYLEKRSSFILCNGSRIDVYPSRMSLQSGGGRKAYLMKFGKSARMSDLVDIFGETEDLKSIGTVAEQKDFLSNWKNSLK